MSTVALSLPTSDIRSLADASVQSIRIFSSWNFLFIVMFR